MYMKQELEIFNFELRKYEKKCMDIPEVQRHTICPPITNWTGRLFVEITGKEQRIKLCRKLRETV